MAETGPPPRIVVTVAIADIGADPESRRRKNELYAEGVRAAGGDPILVDARSDEATRATAFGMMDGLLLSGGADIDPSRYGQAADPTVEVERPRDVLEAAAFAAAERRGVPVLGICRGFQAINVFRGGSLIQDIAGHAGPGYGTGQAWTHAITIDPGSRLGDLLGGIDASEVNTYHHQAVRPDALGRDLRATAWADSPIGLIVEGLEDPRERFVVGLQCHPERTESTPQAFAEVWRAFIEASRVREPV